MRRAATCIILATSAVIGLGGLSGAPAGATPPKPMVEVAPADGHVAPGNQPPELEYPPIHRVAPGQLVAFGLNVVDAESDTVAIELVEKPASAQLDPLTLTVTWRPTPEDVPAGRFRVRITETQRAGGVKRLFFHDFSIAVDPRSRDLPAAPPLGDPVEVVLTIHDPERLAQVNREWPLLKMLDLAQRTALADRGGPAALSEPARLYHDLLLALAARHKNPRLGPDDPAFDKRAFGDPSAWHIVAIRPRLDRRMQELRIIYRDEAAAEPAYLMFRVRLVKDVPDLPPEVVDFANTEMTRLVYEAFFAGNRVSPRLTTDKRAHARAVATLVDKVLSYRNDRYPQLGTELLTIGHEGRLGGGSARNDHGAYASGDGWAWMILKAKVVDASGTPRIGIVSGQIPGVTTAVRPNETMTGWLSVCAPKFDPDNPDHAPGYDVLCRKTQGLTDLPMVSPGGRITSSPIDATNLFVDWKLGDEVATVDLDDPRRDLFDDSGMTCSQCHTRAFGNSDPRDGAIRTPSEGRLPTASPRLPVTFFTMVPEESWRPFMIQFQELQQCQLRDALARFLKIEAAFGCPLQGE